MFVTEFEEEFDSDDESESHTDSKVDPLSLRGHSDSVYETSFVEGSKMLLSCSGDSTIRLWDCNSGSCLATYQGHVCPIWTIDSNESGNFLTGK